MTEDLKNIAQTCLDGAYHDTISFPEIVGTLIRHGFASYRIDFLRHVATYYLNDDTSFELSIPVHHTPIPMGFDAAAVQSAIREAQQQVENYTYSGFCEKVMAAGCVGYIISFPGKRAVYFGRMADMHVENFPQ